MNGVVPIIPGRAVPIKKTQGSPPDKLVISLERKLKEFTVLYEISQLIGSSFDCRKIFSDILNTFHSRLGMNRGTVTLLNPVTGELEI